LIQGQVEEEEEPVQMKELPGTDEIHSDLESRISSMKGGGHSLPQSVRSFFEPRFNHDFGDVRIHTGSGSANVAKSLHSKAFATGRDIVFGANQYAPGTSDGKKLIAHELTHVVQQGQAFQRAYIQRTCNPAPIAAKVGTRSGCNNLLDGIFVPGPLFKFKTSCDEFALGQQAALIRFALTLPPTADLEIHGFASMAGLRSFNEDLGCARATEAARVLITPIPGGAGLPSSRITVAKTFNHGPTPGPAAERQSVVILTTAPIRPPKPKCGPDATQWFVDQVNTAMTDPAVLAVKRDIAAADAIARRHGITASVVAEGGAATAVEAQEARLRITGPAPPPRIGAIVGQMAAGVASRSRAAAALAAALRADPLNAPSIMRDFAQINVHVAAAAFAWKALVDHRARYDFKAHADSMNHPRSAACPDLDCPPGEVGIVTLCPGSVAENCYESDLPGNLFYALIGRHVGWSELTLQLGSQLAELTDVTPRPARPVITWDSPEDTFAISLGFRLPLPLTRAALCSALPAARGSLDSRSGCEDCPDLPVGIRIH